jgi:hypothetical protein
MESMGLSADMAEGYQREIGLLPFNASGVRWG